MKTIAHKQRPIPFSGEMVRAIREGRKTQSRRVIVPTQSTPKVAPLRMEPWMIDGYQERYDDGRPLWTGYHPDYPTGEKWFACPYGQPSDRLWCRETWGTETRWNNEPGSKIRHTAPLWYKADGDVPVWAGRTRAARFMPRWASRITLEIVGVRVEQLQCISEADAIAEGLRLRPDWFEPQYADPYGGWWRDPHDAFKAVWDDINFDRGYGWAANPWVWVVDFKYVEELAP